MTQINASLVAKVIIEQKGCKISTLVAGLAKKMKVDTDEIDQDKLMGLLGQMVADNEIGALEYRLDGKPIMFLIPLEASSIQLSGSAEDTENFPDLAEDVDPEEVPQTVSDDKTEVVTIFPPDLFAGYILKRGSSCVWRDSPELAQASYLEALRANSSPDSTPKVYGAIPLNIQVTLSYVDPDQTVVPDEGGDSVPDAED